MALELLPVPKVSAEGQAPQRSQATTSVIGDAERAWCDSFNRHKNGDGSCPVCGGKGVIARVMIQNGAAYKVFRECDCVTGKRSAGKLSGTGLASGMSFDNFAVRETWQRDAVMKAKAYAKDQQGGWFFMCGKPGTGKTHLCTAMSAVIVESGKTGLYVKWREAADKCKGGSDNAQSRRKAMSDLQNVQYLYIDDFLKSSSTDADIGVALDILDARMNRRLPTCLSSELTVSALMALDEALASRIMQMSKGFYVEVPGTAANYRLRGAR